MEQIMSLPIAMDSTTDQKNQDDIHWDEEKLYLQQRCDSNQQAKLIEEHAKKALVLKKNELKWKLMQVSQTQNLAKLKEIQTAVNYHRRKLSKAQELAVRLREKYKKVIKSAKLTEFQYKKAEAQLSQQERFVADEKMQLTKLAFECLNTGRSLYGGEYKLPENINNQHKIDNPPRLFKENDKRPNGGGADYNSGIKDNVDMLERLTPFLRTARLNANQHQPCASNQLTEQQQVGDQKSASSSGAVSSKPSGVGQVPRKRKRRQISRLSSIYDLNDSIFRNLASYRLTNMLGECSDKTCRHQHKSNYQMTDLERLTDLLSYRPQVAGFKPDPDLSEEQNFKMCRIKLKQFAAKLISRNADKSVEVIARSLIKKIRADQTDVELLLSRRKLPKMAHLIAPPVSTCPCEPVSIQTPADKTCPTPCLELDTVNIKLEPMD